ncbi:MAG TPA: gliding motility-associated C-terminal domain-containing protein [Puia sp.]
MKRITHILAVILLSQTLCQAQTALFNTGDSLYVIQDGTCNYKTVPMSFPGCPNCSPLSIARYKDTVYILTSYGLYYLNLKSPGPCTLVDPNPPFRGNNLTCDRNGLIYSIGFQNILYRYDPHTLQSVNLGSVPFPPSGDICFFSNQLIYASYDGIYSIDMTNPVSVTRLINNGDYSIFGLLSQPISCTQNKLFALGIEFSSATFKMVGVDLATGTFTGDVCDIPDDMLDAASEVEGGAAQGIRIDSLFIQSPCGPELTGSVRILDHNASQFPISYTLDGTTTNTTGFFDALSLGTHNVRIRTQEGCSVDSTFILTRGLSDVFSATHTDPFSCALTDGAIDIRASTGTPPLLFSLDNNAVQSTPHFGNLGAGNYHLKVIDGGHCEKEVTIPLNYKNTPAFFDHVTVTPTVCTSANGSIVITPLPDITPQIFLNDQPQSQSSIQNLDAGSYKLSLISSPTCRYDTTIPIIVLQNPPPDMATTVEQLRCSDHDASIGLSVQGAYGPYKSNLNNGMYNNVFTYTGLAAGSYQLTVMDRNGCTWPSAATIQPFEPDHLHSTVDSTNPDCRELNSGSVTIRVEGSKAPYLLLNNGLTYPNGSTISGLNDGSLTFLITDKNGCITDSVKAQLKLQLSPECDTFFMPNAFTPNGDGKNDFLRPIHSPYLKNYSLAIYNRWGQLIYTGRDFLKGWDGTANGQPLPPGVYVWMVEYETFEKQKRALRGVVMLIR